jgi:hypothetical protein
MALFDCRGLAMPLRTPTDRTIFEEIWSRSAKPRTGVSSGKLLMTEASNRERTKRKLAAHVASGNVAALGRNLPSMPEAQRSSIASDVLSTLALRAEGGASFNKHLTSQAENVPSSVDVSIMNRAASTARPVSYFETCIPSRATDASALGASLST